MTNTLSLWNNTVSQNNFIYYLLGGFLFSFVLCLLITRVLRRKEPNVMVLTSLEDDWFETEPHIYYIVVVSTSYLPGSSCSRKIKVFIQLEGEHGKTPYIQLKTNHAGQNILQRGVTDLFLVKVHEKIGRIEGLVFVMSSGSAKHIPWRVRCVKLYNPCTEVMMSPPVKFMVIESSIQYQNEHWHMKESRYHTLGRSLILYHQWLSVPNTKMRYGAHTETVNVLMIFTAFGILLMSSLIAYILSDTNDNPDLFELSASPLLLGSLISAVSTFIITSAIELQMHFVACRKKNVGMVYSMIRKGLSLQRRTNDPQTQDACFIDLEETASSISGFGRLLSIWNNVDWVNIKKRITKSFSSFFMGDRFADLDKQDSLRTLYKSCLDIDQDFISEMRKRYHQESVPSHLLKIHEILWKHFPETEMSKDIAKKQQILPAHLNEAMEVPVSLKMSQIKGTSYKQSIDFLASDDYIARKHEQPLLSKPKHTSAESYRSGMDMDKTKWDITKKHELTSDELHQGQQELFKSSTEIDMPQEEFEKRHKLYASAQLTHTNNVTFKSVIDLPGGIQKSKSDLEISSSDYLSLDFEVTVGRVITADMLSDGKEKHGQKSLEDVYLDEFTGHRGTDLITYIGEVAHKQKKLIDDDSDLSDSSLDEVSLVSYKTSDEIGASSSHVLVSVPSTLSEESLSTGCFNTRPSHYVIDIPSPFWEMCSNTATDAYPAVTSQLEGQKFHFDNARDTYEVNRSRDQYDQISSATSNAQLSSQRNEKSRLQAGRGIKVAQESSSVIAGHRPSNVSYDDYKHEFLNSVFYKINLTTGLPPNQKHIDVVVKKAREKSNVGWKKKSSTIIDIHLGDKDLERMQESESISISDLADESIRSQLKPDVATLHDLDQLFQSMQNAIKIGITWSYISAFEKQRDLQLWSRSHIEAVTCTLKNFKKQAEGGNLLFSTVLEQGKCWFKNYLRELCIVLGWDLKKKPEHLWQDMEKSMSHVFGMASEAVCNTLRGTCQLLLHRERVTLADILLKSHEVMTGIEANSRSISSGERNFSGALVEPDVISVLDHTYRKIAHTIFIEAVRLGFCEQRVPWNLFLNIFRKKHGESFEEYVRKITSLLIYSSETIVKEYDGENFLIKAFCCYITRLAKEELWKEYQDVQLVLIDMLFKQSTLDVLKRLAKTTGLTICEQVEQLLRQRWIIQGYNPSKRGEIALSQALLCAREMGEVEIRNNLNDKDVFETSCGINEELNQYAKLVTYLQFKRVETRLAKCLLVMVQLKTNDLVINCLQEYLSQQLHGLNKEQLAGAHMHNWKKRFTSFIAESISVKMNFEEEKFMRKNYCRNLLNVVLETESLQHDLFMHSTFPLMEGNQKKIKTDSTTETDKIEKVNDQLLSQDSDGIERTCITEMINELKPIQKQLKFVSMIEGLRGQITKKNYLARIRREQELFIQIQLQNVIDSFYILNDEEVTPKIDQSTLYQLEYDTMGDSKKPLPPHLKIILVIFMCLILAFSEVYTYLVAGQLSSTQVKEWFCYFSLSIVKFGFVFEVIKALVFGMFFISNVH